jgi:hypothetical protein
MIMQTQQRGNIGERQTTKYWKGKEKRDKQASTKHVKYT